MALALTNDGHENVLSSDSGTVGSVGQNDIAMRKHIRFWDKKNKGYITPMDAVAGFTNLGYGLALSVTMGTFLTIILSYVSNPSWVPDPRCRINVRSISKAELTEGANDNEGHFDPEKFQALFANYAKTDASGNTITAMELLSMMKGHTGITRDPFGWSRQILLWTFAYLLVGTHGVMSKDNVQAIYDGTLFYRLHDSRRQAIEGGQNTGPIMLSGVQKPKSAFFSLEHQLRQLVSKFPHSVEPHMHRASRFLGISASPDQKPTNALKGVSVPTPPVKRKRLGGSKETAPTTVEKLTGVQSHSLDKPSFQLEGIQGLTRSVDEQEEKGLTGLKIISDPVSNIDPVVSLNGVRQLDPTDQQESNADWLNTSPLEGVKLSPSETNMTVATKEQEPIEKEPTIFEPVTLTGVAHETKTEQETLGSASPEIPDLCQSFTEPGEPHTDGQENDFNDDDSKSASSEESCVDSPTSPELLSTVPKSEDLLQQKTEFGADKYVMEHDNWPTLATVDKEE